MAFVILNCTVPSIQSIPPNDIVHPLQTKAPHFNRKTEVTSHLDGYANVVEDDDCQPPSVRRTWGDCRITPPILDIFHWFLMYPFFALHLYSHRSDRHGFFYSMHIIRQLQFDWGIKVRSEPSPPASGSFIDSGPISSPAKCHASSYQGILPSHHIPIPTTEGLKGSNPFERRSKLSFFFLVSLEHPGHRFTNVPTDSSDSTRYLWHVSLPYPSSYLHSFRFLVSELTWGKYDIHSGIV